jgi:transcriptional regulator with XRE-family HTH domain
VGFNVELFLLRKNRKWTQAQMGSALGYSKSAIHKVETGLSEGTLEFWRRVQREFNIPDSEMWGLQNGKKYESK